MEAYERLLGDAMAGDATLFARQDVVEAAWAVVDPVLARPGKPHEYAPGSWGPPESDALVAGMGGWNMPLDSRARESAPVVNLSARFDQVRLHGSRRRSASGQPELGVMSIRMY